MVVFYLKFQTSSFIRARNRTAGRVSEQTGCRLNSTFGWRAPMLHRRRLPLPKTGSVVGDGTCLRLFTMTHLFLIRRKAHVYMLQVSLCQLSNSSHIDRIRGLFAHYGLNASNFLPPDTMPIFAQVRTTTDRANNLTPVWSQYLRLDMKAPVLEVEVCIRDCGAKFLNRRRSSVRDVEPAACLCAPVVLRSMPQCPGKRRCEQETSKKRALVDRARSHSRSHSTARHGFNIHTRHAESGRQAQGTARWFCSPALSVAVSRESSPSAHTIVRAHAKRFL